MKKKKTITSRDVKTIRDHHKTNTLRNAAWLFSLTQEEVVNFALSEMRLKNEAYYFILERGLLNDFGEYLNEQSKKKSEFFPHKN